MPNIEFLEREYAYKLTAIVADMDRYPLSDRDLPRDYQSILSLLKIANENNGALNNEEWSALKALILKLYKQGDSGDGFAADFLNVSYNKLICEYPSDYEYIENSRKFKSKLDEKKEKFLINEFMCVLSDLLYNIYLEIRKYKRRKASKIPTKLIACKATGQEL